jgi:hypothetical protein
MKTTGCRKNQTINLPYLQAKRNVVNVRRVGRGVDVGEVFHNGAWTMVQRHTKTGAWTHTSQAAVDYLVEHGY